MQALPPPFRLLSQESVDSTNDEAKRAALRGEGHGLVVWAQEQTAGRGRRGRAWVSPVGNLHCSFLLDPGSDIAKAPQLAFVAAVAARATLAELAPRGAFQVKWPNDVLCGGRKIVGMLLEQAGPLIVVGIGVDVVAAPMPSLYPTTCLREQGSNAVAFDVLAGLAGQLSHWYALWRQEGFLPIRAAWLAGAVGVGAVINVRLSDETVLEGRFSGLDDIGGLLLDGNDGQAHRILAGDVFFPPAR